MKRLLLATNNPGKVRELRRLLDGIPFSIVTPAELGITIEVDETGDSYAANALLKARAFAAAGNCLAIADDSGIEVEAMAGAPGIRSARYGGPGLDDAGRLNRLIEELASVPDGERAARYRAVIAIARPDGRACTFEGTMEGTVARQTRGSRGFGYDPGFLLADGRTAAELSDDEKDAISHRGKAARAAAAWLASGAAEGK